jgi:SAM-dependent methyltransferase
MSIEYYNRNAVEFYSNTINVNMTNHYMPFLELIPKGGRILDAGCGSGRDSLYFLNASYQVVAFDASQEMVKLSTKLIGQPVRLMEFQKMNFVNEFDGIWACASLLHVPRVEMHNVFRRLTIALKPNGIIYASFKYGDKEEHRNGRYFNGYDEYSFEKLLAVQSSLSKISYFVTEDIRQDRLGEKWLNVLLTRKIATPQWEKDL